MSKKKKKPNSKLKVIKTFKIERIDWKDHYTGHGQWTALEDIKPIVFVCTSVGLVIHENDETVILAQNMSSPEKISDTVTILKNCIDYRKKLGELRYVKRD